MNKTLKILLIVLLVISLAFVITGCGKKEEPKETTEDQVPAEQKTSVNTNENTTNEVESVAEVGKSKTYNTFSKLKNNYTMSLKQVNDEEADALAKEINGIFVKKSANTSKGINDLFKRIVNQILFNDDLKKKNPEE